MVTKPGKQVSSKIDTPITIEALNKDHLTEIARLHWAPGRLPPNEKRPPFSPDLVRQIYEKEMKGSRFNPKKIMMLEFSQYLEAYLWPNYNPETASIPHVMSVLVMINEKFRERCPAWQCLVKSPNNFVPFLYRVFSLSLDNTISMAEHCAILTFLSNVFSSVEIDLVRDQIMKFVHISIWANLLPSQRNDILSQNKKLRKYWEKVQNQEKNVKRNSPEGEKRFFEKTYLARLIQKFIATLERVDDESKEVDVDEIRYCERFMQIMIDLEALLPTRRFFNALLHSSHLLVRCVLSSLIRSEAGSLFCQLVDMLKFYARFEIDEFTGQQLSAVEVANRHTAHVVRLQKAAFKYFRESMRDFYLLNVSGVDTRKALTKQFQSMTKRELYRFAEYLHLVPVVGEEGEEEDLLERYSREFIQEALILHCERKANQLEQLNSQPLYPTETVIWDENVVPYEHYSGEGVLALNKLNLQFLTLHDYLLRNFNLFQLESTYEIRQDLEDVLFRMKPWAHETNGTPVFGGWARMALPIENFTIVEVAKPNVGEKSPASVRAEITLNIGKRGDIRSEWEALRKHDVCFLVTCRPKARVGTKFNPRQPFKEQIDVTYVRGCEIEGMLDPNGQVIEEYAAFEKKPQVPGDVRRWRVWLDPNQYRLDMENTADKNKEVSEISEVASLDP